MSIFSFIGKKKPEPAPKITDGLVSPGRVSVPENDSTTFSLNNRVRNLVTPGFQRDYIKVLRNLYKVNPDVSIAVQDMFKLANTGHIISFPFNTDEEASKMKEHLANATRNWSNYTFGVDGLVNKMFVQAMVSGAISIEGVPNKDLTGLSAVLFVNPEDIFFKRMRDGVYMPYQKNPSYFPKKGDYIKLNPLTYKYIGIYNDTDEPYGVPQFFPALDSLVGQHDMKVNFKHIMETAGMVGFLEAKMSKPSKRPSENDIAYSNRLKTLLKKLKENLVQGMRDGVVTGFIDDHEFKLNSTTKDLQNINVPWEMNQQSVANGLGVSGTIIGVNSAATESGASIMLSKMISQLRNMQMACSFALEFLYSLELQLAGFSPKGVKVVFNSTTISDEVKVQQGMQFKVQNYQSLFNQGIINQKQFAWAFGYEKPAEEEPRMEMINPGGAGDVDDGIKKKERKDQKTDGERSSRDRARTQSKRADQDTRKR